MLLEDKSIGNVEVFVQCGALVGLCGLGVLLSERRFLLSILPDAVIERFPASMRRYHVARVEGEAKKDK